MTESQAEGAKPLHDHSPIPWTVAADEGGWSVCDANGDWVCDIQSMPDRQDNAEAEANAHYIVERANAAAALAPVPAMGEIAEVEQWLSFRKEDAQALRVFRALLASHDRQAAELRTLRAALQSIVDTYDMRSELFTSDAECAGNLHDRARAALSTAPNEPAEGGAK